MASALAVYLIPVFFLSPLLIHAAVRPSVVMIAVDDLRNEPGAFGGPAYTPHIDALASATKKLCATGIVKQVYSYISQHRPIEPAVNIQKSNIFKAELYAGLGTPNVLICHAKQAVCGPTRASIFTSRRTNTIRTVTHGMKCVGSPRSPSCYWRDVAGNFSTLPQLFKEHGGYDTVSFGKTFDQRTSGGETCDWPFSWSEPPVACSTAGSDLKHGCDHLTRSSHGLYDKEKEKCGDLIDVGIVTRANAWLKERFSGSKNAQDQQKPFFLAVGLHRPHLPWIVDGPSLAANPRPSATKVGTVVNCTAGKGLCWIQIHRHVSWDKFQVWVSV